MKSVFVKPIKLRFNDFHVFPKSSLHKALTHFHLGYNDNLIVGIIQCHKTKCDKIKSCTSKLLNKL